MVAIVLPEVALLALVDAAIGDKAPPPARADVLPARTERRQVQLLREGHRLTYDAVAVRTEGAAWCWCCAT